MQYAATLLTAKTRQKTFFDELYFISLLIANNFYFKVRLQTMNKLIFVFFLYL